MSDSCPNCGMEPSEWSEPAGYQKEALVFCCAGCAEDTGCACFHPATRKSAPAPRSRRHPKGLSGAEGPGGGVVPGVRGPGGASRPKRPALKGSGGRVPGVAPKPPAGSEEGTLGDEGGAGQTRGSGPRED